MSPKRRKTSTRFTKQRLASLDEEDDEPETDEEVDEDRESEEEIVVSSKKRKRVRPLGDEFDRIAEEAKNNKKLNKRGKGKEKEVEKPRRVSPRKK
jgi:hypothetical protein